MRGTTTKINHDPPSFVNGFQRLGGGVVCCCRGCVAFFSYNNE